MFLKKCELTEMTGYQRPKSLMRWLSENGYPFEVGADGYPRVLTECVLKRLGINTLPTYVIKSKPNFSAL